MIVHDEKKGVLEHREYKKFDYAKTNVQLKQSQGVLFVDVRKWFKNMENNEWHSTKSGILLEIEDWVHILPLIQELVSANIQKR